MSFLVIYYYNSNPLHFTKKHMKIMIENQNVYNYVHYFQILSSKSRKNFVTSNIFSFFMGLQQPKGIILKHTQNKNDTSRCFYVCTVRYRKILDTWYGTVRYRTFDVRKKSQNISFTNTHSYVLTYVRTYVRKCSTLNFIKSMKFNIKTFCTPTSSGTYILKMRYIAALIYR